MPDGGNKKGSLAATATEAAVENSQRGSRKRRAPGDRAAVARANGRVPRLARQAYLYEITLSSIVDFVYIFDRKGRFLFANEALANLLDRTPASMVGKDFHD